MSHSIELLQVANGTASPFSLTAFLQLVAESCKVVVHVLGCGVRWCRDVLQRQDGVRCQVSPSVNSPWLLSCPPALAVGGWIRAAVRDHIPLRSTSRASPLTRLDLAGDRLCPGLPDVAPRTDIAAVQGCTSPRLSFGEARFGAVADRAALVTDSIQRQGATRDRVLPTCAAYAPLLPGQCLLLVTDDDEDWHGVDGSHLNAAQHLLRVLEVSGMRGRQHAALDWGLRLGVPEPLSRWNRCRLRTPGPARDIRACIIARGLEFLHPERCSDR
mmetsp:Transcript_44314/g.96296  ORF Transcript_44314/g.96296 Transcript_44314/m.96296 type:complete len:272 (+) Transcript_44314:969-1784(+)